MSYHQLGEDPDLEGDNAITQTTDGSAGAGHLQYPLQDAAESSDQEEYALGPESHSPEPILSASAKRSERRKWIIKLIIFGLCVGGAIAVYFSPILTDYVPARHCLAAAILVIAVWVTEVAPVWAGSLAVPLLVVWGAAYSDCSGSQPHLLGAAATNCAAIPTGCSTLAAPDAAARAASKLFSKTVLLAFGAFTMSSALTKYELSDRLAYFILSRVGRRPWVVTLTIMGLGLFLACWVSNVASPVVCLSIIRPILKDLAPEDPFIKVLLLAIAFSNNIGGMTTPIASPQNLLAMQTAPNIGWPKWLAVSIPTSIICTLVSFGVVWLFYRPKLQALPPLPETQLKKIGVKHIVVLAVCVITIVLWAVNSQIQAFVGDTGMVGLLPVIIFFTTGIMNKNDFKALPWDVLMLLAGGMVLGDAMSDQLLCLVANVITSVVQSQPLWVIALAFVSLMWVIGNFISHTVSAIILLPVVSSVAASLPGSGDLELLVITTVLVDSGAMGLPVSSFPNAQMYSETDKHGKAYLTGADFMKVGFLVGILEVGVVVSLTYFIGLALF